MCVVLGAVALIGACSSGGSKTTASAGSVGATNASAHSGGATTSVPTACQFVSSPSLCETVDVTSPTATNGTNAATLTVDIGNETTAPSCAAWIGTPLGQPLYFPGIAIPRGVDTPDSQALVSSARGEILSYRGPGDYSATDVVDTGTAHYPLIFDLDQRSGYNAEYSTANGGQLSLTIKPDGSGSLTFTGLTPWRNHTSTKFPGPLTGTVTWTCVNGS